MAIPADRDPGPLVTLVCNRAPRLIRRRPLRCDHGRPGRRRIGVPRPDLRALRAVFGTPILPKPTLTPFAALANNLVGEPVPARQGH